METLKGIFPTPKATPKRDFLKENVMRLKLIKKNQNLSKTNTTVVPPIVKGPLPLKGWQRLPTRSSVLRESPEQNTSRDSNKKVLTTIKAPTQKFRKMPSETSLSTLLLSSNIKKLSATKNRDISCQTVDTTDDLFLKDVTIKYPSAVVLESIRSGRTTATNKTKKFDNELTLNFKEFGGGDKTTFYAINQNDTHSKLQIDENKSERFIETPLTEDLTQFPNTTIDYDSDEFNDDHALETAANNLNDYNNDYDDNKNTTDDIDYINSFEDRSIISKDIKLKKREQKLELPPSYRIGKVPKYLRTRKEELIKIAEKVKELEDCPDGHVVLSEHDRKEALKIAKKKFKDLVDELNKMPMTAETMKIRNRKIEIEKELNLLENNIKIFSRQKVYVKIEA